MRGFPSGSLQTQIDPSRAFGAGGTQTTWDGASKSGAGGTTRCYCSVLVAPQAVTQGNGEKASPAEAPGLCLKGSGPSSLACHSAAHAPSSCKDLNS